MVGMKDVWATLLAMLSLDPQPGKWREIDGWRSKSSTTTIYHKRRNPHFFGSISGTKDYHCLDILQYVTHKSVLHIFCKCTWNVTRSILLRRKCYAHLNKNAKQSWVHSTHAKGGITLWQNFHHWESWMSPWAIFFWKYRFEVYCFCLSGTIFHRDPSLGSGVEERGLKWPKTYPQGIMVPWAKQGVGTGVLTQMCDISLTAPPVKHRHLQPVPSRITGRQFPEKQGLCFGSTVLSLFGIV